MEDRHLSLSEVAELMEVTERTVRRWIKSGRLKAYKPGRDYRIPESAVKEFIERSEAYPKAQAPLPLEDSEQRRHAGVEGLANIQALVRRRLSRFDREVSDPESTKFKSATLATDWLTDVQNEATDWITWGLNDAVASEASTVDTLRAGLWALGLIAEIGRIKRLAERRIQANQEPPDELARKRAEVASRELQEAGRRLQEFQAASG